MAGVGTAHLRDAQAQRYGSLEEKNRNLQAAYAQKVRDFQQHPRFDPSQPTILSFLRFLGKLKRRIANAARAGDAERRQRRLSTSTM